MSQTELYQSVLKKLGDIPAEYLSQVDAFLSQLNREVQNPASELPSDTVSTAPGRLPSLQEAIKPIRKAVTLDTLKQEQRYQPIHKEDFVKKAQAIDIQEPLEKLLKMLD